MSHYKLTYFDGRGRAETLRLIFAYAKVEYEDIRMKEGEWPKVKPTTPFGQVPVLEVDGVVLAQSNSIARFLARRYNLAGKTEIDQARVDMIVDCLEDTLKPAIGIFMEENETRKAELKKKFLEEQLPTYLDNLEKILVENNGGDSYFVGNDLTWADLSLLSVWDMLLFCDASELLDKRTKLAALRRRVEGLPRIADWMAKRPSTKY